MRRRRIVAGATLAVLAGGAAAFALSDRVEDTIREVTLPLRHEDIIRQQAREKDLDPALIAGVIYAESKFRDQTSKAGAEGLMQILPETAEFIARRSGGTQFVRGDLGDPDVNIRYGAYYLRYLIDRYGGNEIAAIAAYNAGHSNVDSWGGPTLKRRDIRFPETRDYVGRVQKKRREYRRRYRKELGLGS